MRKNNFNEILSKLDIPDHFNFSKFLYKDNLTKSEIICLYHGSFYRDLNQLINGHYCDKCSDKITSTYNFIKKSKDIHGDIFDYSKTNYISSREKLKIICKEHGEFDLYPIQHIRGQGCIICRVLDSQLEEREKFIAKSKLLHNDKYDYSQVVYKNNKTHVKIVCPEHGVFVQRPDNHLSNLNGCPGCSLSIGEKIISAILNKMDIFFEV